MGHYRSEMGYEEEDRKQETDRLTHLDRLEARVKAEIKQKGVARVIAEMLDDKWYRLHLGA